MGELRGRARGSAIRLGDGQIAELPHRTWVRNLQRGLAQGLRKDEEELQLLRRWSCRPLALLATAYDEVLLVEPESTFAADPTALFASATFSSAGMLLFRSQMTHSVKETLAKVHGCGGHCPFDAAALDSFGEVFSDGRRALPGDRSLLPTCVG